MMPLPWKSRSKRSHAIDGDAGRIDGGMEPIVEGSHERSVGSSSTSNVTSTIQLNEELEQLRREIELLKATQSRTQDDSPRTLQLREQMDQLRMENEKLRSASITHHSPSRLNDQYHIPDGKEPRTPDGKEPRTPESKEPRSPEGKEPRSPEGKEPRTPEGKEPRTPEGKEPRTPEGKEPRTPEGKEPRTPEGKEPRTPDGRTVEAGEQSMANKYVYETPSSRTGTPDSMTMRSQSLPKPSAPPGASSAHSLIHHPSLQVVREGMNHGPSSPGTTERKSPQSLQALGSMHVLRQEKERLMAEAELSSRTRAQLDNDKHVSVRTLQALDEVAALKRQVEMLKSSKVVPSVSRVEPPASRVEPPVGRVEPPYSRVEPRASRVEPPASKVEPAPTSERTRQVMNQLDKLRRQNEILKANKAKEMEDAKRRLAYFEQNHAAASQIRMQEVKQMLVTSQELDLAFLMDATGSMQTSIDMIKTTVNSMAIGIMASYPQCKLRVAFVPYRDYEDSEQDDSEVCDFTTSFSGPESDFSLALSRVHASGGGDDAEDVFSGIARVAQLSWDARNRLLIHIADAPCHGLQFHDGVGDFYPNGDKLGRTIEAQLQILYEVCHVSAYFFCHLNSSTRKMIQAFQKAVPVGSNLSILEEQFENISSIPQKVITLCRGTIQKTLSVLAVQQPMGIQFVNENVVKTVPQWSQVPIQFGVHFRCKWYRALDDMLSRINDKMALDEESMDHIQIQIAQHPFSDEGAVRWPYHALIKYPNEAPRSMVVKRFKTPLGRNVREIHKRERYWAQMEVQSVSAHMANEFNKCTANMKNVKRVEFTQVTTLEVGSGPSIKYYNMESLLEGEWLRYSNNGGYVNTLDYAAVLQAFTHWTHERSRGLLMVTDLQGVRMTNDFGENVFCLCDPAIHCTDVLRFTRTNLGQEGFKLFFDTHKCNDVCAKLGLAQGKAGRTISGTQVGSYW